LRPGIVAAIVFGGTATLTALLGLCSFLLWRQRSRSNGARRERRELARGLLGDDGPAFGSPSPRDAHEIQMHQLPASVHSTSAAQLSLHRSTAGLSTSSYPGPFSSQTSLVEARREGSAPAADEALLVQVAALQGEVARLRAERDELDKARASIVAPSSEASAPSETLPEYSIQPSHHPSDKPVLAASSGSSSVRPS